MTLQVIGAGLGRTGTTSLKVHLAIGDLVGPSDLLVLGIPRALDGLGAGVARAARTVPGCRILAIAAR